MKKNTAVAILAAGLGTRMKSKHAKVLHEAGGKSLVSHVADAALAVAAPECIAVVVGHEADKVEAELAGRGVLFAEQRVQKGTGHALSTCRAVLEDAGEFVVILCGDAPLLRVETLRELIDSQSASDAAATVITTTIENADGYGRILRDARGNVTGIVEQKAATPEQLQIREINSGIYCFRADSLWKHIGDIQPNPMSGEYYLTDMVEILVGHRCRFAALHVEDSNELLGINTREELAEADRVLRARKARELMLSGVTINKPETVTIDADVRVGQDTTIEPFAQLLGKTRIGADCRIGACSIIRNSQLGDGATVEAFTHIVDSRLDAGAKAGPYARLRPKAHLEAGSEVGNFVELKNTKLGPGSKARHLTYLGDSVIGSKVNVGAGTITCNYDGEKKFETRIADGVFVGSNSTLVAPLEIGKDSYIAAGSVITSSVPEDTLALGRARQSAKPGWPSKRKARNKAASADH
jgi:bifunctional UDP-N-acetylglucosamine pyrophosphorylase/glucosamine-1-phosphate N-acetyltransferase